jgi:cyclic pyranopterin phosphate synthase
MADQNDQLSDQLTHLAGDGSARMVDVGGKEPSSRRARASAIVRMSQQTAQLVADGDAPKGDVIGSARIAGIFAAKRVPELIPLSHPLPLDFIDVTAEIDVAAGTVSLEAEARTNGRTGVEIEAMTACSVAALTVYDMVKGVERGVTIEAVRLLEKTGGKADWFADKEETR